MSAETTLILLRHGEVEGIKPARFRGRRDVPLSADGEAQAQAAAQRLARRSVLGGGIDAIYASPLVRCQQTASHVSQTTGLTPTTLPGLIDIDYGDWTWREHAEIAREAPDAWRVWKQAPELARFPGGESLQDLAARATGALRQVLEAHTGGTLVLVTHDAVVRVLVIETMGLGLNLYHRLKVAPASLSELCLPENAFELVRLDDTGHLDS